MLGSRSAPAEWLAARLIGIALILGGLLPIGSATAPIPASAGTTVNYTYDKPAKVAPANGWLGSPTVVAIGVSESITGGWHPRAVADLGVAANTAKLPTELTVGNNAKTGVDVYVGVTKGADDYVGITNNLARRGAEHGDRCDLFTMLLPDGRHLFGRVIQADLPRERAPMPGSNLLYFYRVLSQTTAPPWEQLVPGALLIPPVFTNRMGWTKGVFQTVGSRPLEEPDLLAQHTFWDALRKHYVDEEGRPLARPAQPAGEWGLMSYRMIDDLISDALGIARVPDWVG